MAKAKKSQERLTGRTQHLAPQSDFINNVIKNEEQATRIRTALLCNDLPTFWYVDQTTNRTVPMKISQHPFDFLFSGMSSSSSNGTSRLAIESPAKDDDADVSPDAPAADEDTTVASDESLSKSSSSTSDEGKAKKSRKNRNKNAKQKARAAAEATRAAMNVHDQQAAANDSQLVVTTASDASVSSDADGDLADYLANLDSDAKLDITLLPSAHDLDQSSHPTYRPPSPMATSGLAGLSSDLFPTTELPASDLVSRASPTLLPAASLQVAESTTSLSPTPSSRVLSSTDSPIVSSPHTTSPSADRSERPTPDHRSSDVLTISNLHDHDTRSLATAFAEAAPSHQPYLRLGKPTPRMLLTPSPMSGSSRSSLPTINEIPLHDFPAPTFVPPPASQPTGTEVLPLTHTWTLYFSDSSKSKKAATEYEDGLVSLFTSSTAGDLLGSWKALRRAIAYSKKRPIEPVNERVAPGQAGLGLHYLADDNNFHFFKQGVRPMWEDPMFVKGGKLMLAGPVIFLDHMYLDIILHLIGGAFDAACPPAPQSASFIGGVMFSRRKAQQSRIELWLGGPEPPAPAWTVAVGKHLEAIVGHGHGVKFWSYKPFH